MQKKTNKNMHKKGGRSMGLQILGWSMVVIGAVIAIWGFYEFPASEWFGIGFLNYVVSGMVLIAGGLALLKVSALMTVAAIIIASLLLAVYIWNMQLDFFSALLSYVLTAALTTWLVSLLLR
ncbi:hypothetical protein [Bacillus sp. JCM 19034]|uniref:hypothetical protein n=1 Tax=Bacillus sp. JCM 19034 TaxID=1481928 RepID=UPI000781F233|nr:hypothetical protein [Bacillus sp. JCM 19034]